jgi:hypothetical protein
MSDVELIFVILAVIYGWECACWLRGGTLAFRTFFGKGWQAVPPGKLLGNQHGGFIFANPLPPLGTLLQSGTLPVSFSPDGVLAYVASHFNPGPRPWQSGRWIPFEKLETVTAKGKWVLANGQRLVHTGSNHSATRLVELLSALKALRPDEREGRIRSFCEAGFDSGVLDQSWETLQELSRSLRWLANGLFLLVFAAAPLAIWLAGFRLAWPGLLAGLLALAVGIAVLFLRAHRQLYPKLDDERFTQFIIVLLSPANAIRAVDLLTRPALEAFHPVALARKFFTPAVFETFASRCVRDLRHPARPEFASNDPAARNTENWFRRVQLESVEKFLSGHGVGASKLVLVPAKAESGCVSYCPRCLAQFTVREGVCEDCGGLPLAGFEKGRS